MNYYIQGNKEKADQIKAAFEKLGYSTAGWNYKSNRGIYFTNESDKSVDHTGVETFINLIKTHPDYKELEFPVKPKFKVGDRVIHDGKVRTITFMDENYYDFDGGVAGCRIELQDELKPASNFKKGDLLIHNNNPACRVLVVDVSEKYGYQLQDGSGRYHLSFTTVENEYHLWTIADAKDGDVLAADECYVIFKEVDGLNIKCYCTYHYIGFNPIFYIDTLQNKTAFKPATQERCDWFFKKMKEAGYEWDEKKKELKKIQPHYDIASFHAGMPVLVRDMDGEQWTYTTYSHYDSGRGYKFMTSACQLFVQCIPFEGNEHLLGTPDMCDEQYINW